MNNQLFRITGVKTQLSVRGLADRLKPGELPRIEQAVNEQEVFDSSSRIARRFMRLEGENWDLEFDTRELTIWAQGFVDCHQIEEGVSFFVGQIKKTAQSHFWPGEISVYANWPLEPSPHRQKSAGQILFDKSSRLKDAHLQLLPQGGILGAGISLLGLMPEEDDQPKAAWVLEAGPVMDSLQITLALNIVEPEPRKWPDDELDVIESSIRRAYNVMNNDVKAFIDAVMP